MEINKAPQPLPNHCTTLGQSSETMKEAILDYLTEIFSQINNFKTDKPENDEVVKQNALAILWAGLQSGSQTCTADFNVQTPYDVVIDNAKKMKVAAYGA